MGISVGRIENDLADGRLTLNNIGEFEDIKERMAGRGIDDEYIASISTLLDQSIKTLDKYKAEMALQIGLTGKMSAKEGEAYGVYVECVEIGRLVFEDNPGIMKLLGLTGRRSKALNKWTAQSRRFFKEALNREDILQGLAKYNLTKEVLENGQKLVGDLLDLKYRQEEQKGKVQTAYEERDKVYKVFRKPMRQLRKLLRIEYKKEPQQLERLGIRAYSDGYVKAETRRKNEEKKRKEAEEKAAAEVEETKTTAAAAETSL